MWKPSSRGFELLLLLVTAARRVFEFIVEIIVEFIVRRVRADASRNLRANAVVCKSRLAYSNRENAKIERGQEYIVIGCVRRNKKVHNISS